MRGWRLPGQESPWARDLWVAVSQGPRQEFKFMGSKPLWWIKNYLILVPFIVKIWVCIQFPQKLIGSKTLPSKLIGSTERIQNHADEATVSLLLGPPGPGTLTSFVETLFWKPFLIMKLRPTPTLYNFKMFTFISFQILSKMLLWNYCSQQWYDAGNQKIIQRKSMQIMKSKCNWFIVYDGVNFKLKI